MTINGNLREHVTEKLYFGAADCRLKWISLYGNFVNKHSYKNRFTRNLVPSTIGMCSLLEILIFFATLLSVAHGQTYTYISPATTNPLTKYGAGGPVVFNFTATAPSSATVRFACVNNTAPSFNFTATRDIAQTITIPNNFYGNVCEFKLQVSGGVQITNNSTITVTQNLTFDLPLPLSEQIIPLFVDYQLSTGFVNISTTVGGKIACPDSGNEKLLTLNTVLPDSFELNSSFYGLCNLSVISEGTPNYFNLPEPVSFWRRFELIFEQVPTAVVLGGPFTVQIASTGTPPLGSRADLGLFCGGSDVPTYKWDNIELGMETILYMPGYDVPSGPGCSYKALPTETYFKASLPAPVLIKYPIDSPFGGPLFDITSEGIIIFLRSVLSTTEYWYALTLQ